MTCLIPFYIDYDEEYNTLYKFRWQPETISKSKPYITIIKIDELNDSLILYKECSCDGNFRYKKECKHIRESLEFLKKFGIEYRE